MFGDSFTITSEESLQKMQIPAAERRPHKTWIESAWAATALQVAGRFHDLFGRIGKCFLAPCSHWQSVDKTVLWPNE